MPSHTFRSGSFLIPDNNSMHHNVAVEVGIVIAVEVQCTVFRVTVLAARCVCVLCVYVAGVAMNSGAGRLHPP